MISMIVGPKGTGKTKTFIEKVNAAASGADGNVVCIEKGNRLMFDLSRNIRMINADDFDLPDQNVFYGFISGVISQDFDTTDIFIEKLNKILPYSEHEAFMEKLEKMQDQFKVNFTITISADEAEIPAGVKKYIV